MMYSAELKKIVEAFQLENILPEISLEGRCISRKETNRPALQLTGYFDHFDANRIQIIGYMEYTYIARMTKKEKKERFEKLLSFDIP